MPVDELAALLRVVTLIADLDPADAWELDAQLAGLAKVTATFAEGLGTWGERLTEIGLHDSVTAAAATGSDHLSQTAVAFAGARRNLRTVYAAQFAAAEAQVSQVQRRDFWGETPHSGAAAQASPGTPPPATHDEPAAPAEVQSGAITLPGGKYLDWSCSISGSGGSGGSVELGDGTDALALEFTPEKLADLHRLLGLALTNGSEARYFLGGLNPNPEGQNHYIEWGTPRPDGSRSLEFGEAGGDTVTIDLSRDELQALHEQLTEDLSAAEGHTVGVGGGTQYVPPREYRVLDVEVTVPQPAAVPEPGRSPEEIRPPNGEWGIDQGLMHFDSALGVLWNTLGDDRHLQVDGRALGNLITDLGEGITRRHHDTNDALRELRRIRAQLPDASTAAQRVDTAIGRLDAPDRPAPTLPDTAPQQLKDLMADLNAINLVRRGYDTSGREPFHETDQLADSAHRWLNGKLSRGEFERDIQALTSRRHESSEGWTEIREAVGRALRDFRQWARRPS